MIYEHRRFMATALVGHPGFDNFNIRSYMSWIHFFPHGSLLHLGHYSTNMVMAYFCKSNHRMACSDAYLDLWNEGAVRHMIGVLAAWSQESRQSPTDGADDLKVIHLDTNLNDPCIHTENHTDLETHQAWLRRVDGASTQDILLGEEWQEKHKKLTRKVFHRRNSLSKEKVFQEALNEFFPDFHCPYCDGMSHRLEPTPAILQLIPHKVCPNCKRITLQLCQPEEFIKNSLRRARELKKFQGRFR